MITKMEDKKLPVIILLAVLIFVGVLLWTTDNDVGPVGGCDEVFVDGRDEREYELIEIDDRCWFAEDLRYGEGDPDLVEAENRRQWEGAGVNSYPALMVDENLYNWYAVESLDLCPDGWSVPTDDEWHSLENHLSLEECNPDRTGSFGCYPAGIKLKGDSDIEIWNEESCIDSEYECSGFSATPTGARYKSGTNFGEDIAFYWTSSESEDGALFRNIRSGRGDVFRNDIDKSSGMAIRCIQDE